jgi:tetratricopeptide (TPR) repeat protein
MSKINPWFGCALAALGAAAWTQPAVAGSDLWWHLASGRDIWAAGAVPNVDPYSHTSAGAIWMNHEWLWDVLYWGAYSLHPQLVAWLNLGVVMSAYGLIFWVALRWSGSLFPSIVAVWLAAAAAHWFVDIRPHLFTLLFVGLFLATRHWRYAPWMWPPLLIVWTNLHAGFVFGIGMIGLHVLGRTIESGWSVLRSQRPSGSAGRSGRATPPRTSGASPTLGRLARSVPWLEWGCLAGAMAGTLLNPFGIHIFEYPLAYLDSASPFRLIIEWQRPPLGLDPQRFDGRFWWLAALGLAAVPAAVRRTPYHVALAAVTLAMAVTSRRFIPLFGFTVAPIVAMGGGWLVAAAREHWPSLRDRRLGWAMSGVALALVALFWRDVRVYPDLLARWTQDHFYPEAAVQYLRALEPPKRLLNLYNWGGYLMLHAPGIPVFIDGRANTIYGDRVYMDYLRIQGAARGYRALLARYRVDMVLMPQNYATALDLVRGPGAWRPIYEDRAAVLLVPPGSPYLERRLPDAETVVGEHPDRLVMTARREALSGRFEQAERTLERAIELGPLHYPTYAELGATRVVAGNPDGVEDAIERGIRALPRETEHLRRLAAQLYDHAGDLDRAIESLRGGLPTGPFQGATGARRYLDELEKRRSEARAKKGGRG